MRRDRLAERRLGVGQSLAAARPVAAADQEGGMAGAPAEIADQPGAEDDERERHVEEEDRDEGRRRDADHDAVLQRPLADRARPPRSTTASTAALRPKNSAATMPTLPQAA